MKETERMLNIIHTNCKNKQLANLEREENCKKREKRQQKRTMVVLVILAIVTLVALGIYTNKQVKGCMDQGGTYEFCRYAGE